MRGFHLAFLFILTTAAHADPMRILHVGDSHTAGSYGKFLDALLRDLPETQVMSIGSCGSSMGWFLGGRPIATGCGYWSKTLDGTVISSPYGRRHVTPKLSKLMDEVGPDLVIVSLGSNSLGVGSSSVSQSVARFINEIKTSNPKAKCLWVGPPHGMHKTEPKFGNLYRAIQKGVGDQCTFFDSRPEKLPYLHYGKLWDEYKPILAEINREREARGKPRLRVDGRHYDTLGSVGRRAVRRWAGEVIESVKALSVTE